jgi:hypothetical protein
MLKTLNESYRDIEKCVAISGPYMTAILKREKYPILDDTFISILETFEEEKLPTIKEEVITVKLLCNWLSSEALTTLWDKMSMGGGRWNDIKLVTDSTPNYWVIINKPPINELYIPERTIVIQMEPHMEFDPTWGEWADPDESKFLAVLKHSTSYNNVEWHISWTYPQLMTTEIEKSIDDRVSTVLSTKYQGTGQILRIDFAKYLDEQEFPLDVFGMNKCGYQSYKGPLPYHTKDNAMFPYKYVFNAENNAIPNYFTEKLVDGILAECLVFYWGCPNIADHINPSCFVLLPLEEPEKALAIMKQAMEEDWWGQRIETIRKEKKRILTELQFFPRIEEIINWD